MKVLNDPYRQLLEKLNTQLKTIDLEEEDVLIKSQQAIELTRAAVESVGAKLS